MDWLKENLSDLAAVSSGIPFRARIQSEPGGRIAVIQPRDLSATGKVQIETSAKVTALPGSAEASLRTGDVLLQPRGTRYSAAVLHERPIPVAAAAPLLVLRCDPGQIDPEFLVLFLQLPRTQAALRNEAVGTYIPQVPRSAVANLSVDLPDLASQRKLVELDRIMRREAEVTTRLLAKRERLLELAVRELAKKDRGRQNAAGPEPVPESALTPSGTVTKKHLRGEL